MSQLKSREDVIDGFLARVGWQKAKRTTLAGDASMRRYERLLHPVQGPAILMDAPPEKGEDIRPFRSIAAHLKAINLSPPDLLECDVPHGLMILEDLGDALFARCVADDPTCEWPLYEAAIDALVALQQQPAPEGLAGYDQNTMAQASALALDWYLPAARGTAVTEAEQARFTTAVSAALGNAGLDWTRLVLRDYHAENLIWLPQRTGAARVGLLDFQDAMLGPAAYDLASLLIDARRDVSADTKDRGLAHFANVTGIAEDVLRHQVAALSAQRNLRIIGVFARLCIRDGKPGYPALLPRVWHNLSRDLAHPALADLREVVATVLPAPSQTVLAAIHGHHG